MTLRSHIPRFNRRVINPVARKFAGRVPPFSLLEHAGRISGTRYQTPIMSFLSGGDVLIALTYVPGTEWVRNVVASGGCTITHRSQRIDFVDPKLLRCKRNEAPLPWMVQQILAVMQVRDFLQLSPVHATKR